MLPETGVRFMTRSLLFTLSPLPTEQPAPDRPGELRPGLPRNPRPLNHSRDCLEGSLSNPNLDPVPVGCLSQRSEAALLKIVWTAHGHRILSSPGVAARLRHSSELADKSLQRGRRIVAPPQSNEIRIGRRPGNIPVNTAPHAQVAPE